MVEKKVKGGREVEKRWRRGEKEKVVQKKSERRNRGGEEKVVESK